MTPSHHISSVNYCHLSRIYPRALFLFWKLSIFALSFSMASPSFSALGRKFLICTLALWVIILRCSGSSVSRLRLVGEAKISTDTRPRLSLGLSSSSSYSSSSVTPHTIRRALSPMTITAKLFYGKTSWTPIQPPSQNLNGKTFQRGD